MKILKIFGVVVSIHVFALMLIFANPGCSSTMRSIPAPSDTLAPAGSGGPTVSVPLPSNTVTMPMGAPPPSFNPDAPAMGAPAGGGGVRFTPTRPGTPAATTLAPEQKIDVTPATTYTVMNGDNLWTLTKKFNLKNPAELASANNLKTNAVLHPGQKLLIPGKSMSNATPAAPMPEPAAVKKTAEVAAARASGESVKHVVKPGESLSAIAQQYGVKQGDIAVANNITDPNKIRPGMELTIPGWQATKAAKSAPKANAKATAPKAIDVGAFDTPAPAPSSISSPVPVIQIDGGEGPLAPAPKP
jgi:LysM repeat protein